MTDLPRSPLGIDATALERWFAAHVPGGSGPLQLTLIAGGHSNLTYRLDDGVGRRFALRRPPLGLVAAGAHDVAREFRILAALRTSTVPIPPVVALCTDMAIMQAPFYLMQWVDGFVPDSPASVEHRLPTAQDRRRAAYELVDALAKLHRLDVDAVGLGTLGPREDYLPRQLERMKRNWEKNCTRELAQTDALHARLVRHCPPQRHTGLVHSDYRLGNVIIASDGRLAAILDWELCALGDVLVDLAFLMTNWDLPDDPWANIWMAVPPTRAGGFPDREQMIARYALKTGFDVHALHYYRAFCYWRSAILAEGIKRRYETGAMAQQTADPAVLDARVRGRLALADQCLQEAGY
jgi:aminoglycoside phosphotransferase (APT) family kinase protein